ncbi:MAG: translation initiation factor IF-3 [Aquificaceae bacterium]|nr:translation initiation factor IF-3 [Aquificaceae bacterium]MCS7196579.1 translation initiation factor IF-3 [Aquificaceae bacterium]MCX7989854.1 translation initiation factor IF-3 [Aquificaceae bacterium]MDW8032091.1 translation initiation factor IF-3 [Aquificaceae bacterium]MDW8294408.1 translation initiation factor IF-3 [Aquificaceae bacterium]
MQDYRVNRQIRAKEVRLIDEGGKQIGIVPLQDALRIAGEKGLDLVEVAPQANPPVCKILDYGKFLYELKKKEKEAKKKQREHAIEVKDMMLSLRIDEHDLKVKLKHMREFLADGDKVRIRIRFRGREHLHPELGEKLANRIIEELSDAGQLEAPVKKEGNFLVFALLPKRK